MIKLDSFGLSCSLCLSGYTTVNYWILGDAFMRGWYNIHDHTNKRMGFVPLATGSTKQVPSRATSAPTTPLPLADTGVAATILGVDARVFIVMVTFLVVASCAAVFICIFCYKLVARTASIANR